MTMITHIKEYEKYCNYTDLQFFVDFLLPSKIDSDIIAAQIENCSTSITTDQAINAWFEHDALHYLSNQPFDKKGESNVAYLEKKFNRGWLPFGKEYNFHTPAPFNFPKITQDLIIETAEQIKNLCE